MVKLVAYQIAHFDELNAFQLDEIQSEFTASFYQNIVERKIESIQGKFPVTILYDEKPVGFFILDNSEEKFIFVENPDEILLRSLSLSPDYQGKGIGKQTMLHLDEFVQNHFPEITTCI